MQKKLLFLFIFITLISIDCFAQTVRYRYAMITEKSLIIADFKEKIPDENLSSTFVSLNSKQERFEAEGGFNNIKKYYYSGALSLMYFDYTKNSDEPDCSYIDSWSDFMEYVRGTK